MKCRACKIFDTLQLNDRCPWCPSIFKSNFEHFLHQTPPRRSKTWEAETTFDGSTDVRWQQNTFVREFYLNQEISTMWVGEPDYLITWTQTATCRKRKRSKKIHSTAPLFFANVFVKKHGRYIYKTNTKCCNNIKWQQEFMRTLKPLQIHLNTFTVSKYTRTFLIHAFFQNDIDIQGSKVERLNFLPWCCFLPIL